jgi:acid stress-induced BolA-like protein IbaG/YrbA
MDTEQIKTLLLEALELDEVTVKSDGSHYHVTAVGQVFENLSRVKQQQYVYKPLSSHIADGTMHAVSIKTYTPAAWEKDKKLQSLL